MEQVRCDSGHMPENDERQKNRKAINVLVTTAYGRVTKIQRVNRARRGENAEWEWAASRIYKDPIAWMYMPKPYKEK